MKRLRELLAHAFHVEPPGPAEPTDVERPIIERLCREVVRRRMTTPALLALECSRPMNYLGSQAMHFFQPMATVLVNPAQWDAFAAFLERRGSIEYLARRLEDLEEEYGVSGSSPPAASTDPRTPDGGGCDASSSSVAGRPPRGNAETDSDRDRSTDADSAARRGSVGDAGDGPTPSPPIDPNRLLDDRNQL